MKRILYFFLPLILTSCSDFYKPSPVCYVDPFIGTDYHGHTFPGVTMPFGLVQLSPDTGTSGWDWASGYHSSDNSIIGFSYSHLSGTGSADLGDILFMPTLSPKYKPGSKENPDEGYRSRFTHESEKAEAGYYSVYLNDVQTMVELTATEHVGMQKYTFGTEEDHYVMLDLSHGISDEPVEGYIKKVSDRAVEGYRRSKGWADDHTVYFYAEFSMPFDSVKICADDTVILDEAKASRVVSAIKFLKNVDELEIKVGISYVDIDGAKGNLEAEAGDGDFKTIRRLALQSWNKILSRVEVEGNKTRKKIFYTSLYHSMIAPYLMSDSDGRYRSSNTNIYKSEEPNYGLYSTWDTFRALHPLLSIVAPEKNTQFVKSLIRYYEESGRLPVWDLNMRENFCMIGYHSVPIIADAFFKGEKFDAQKALEAMVNSSKDYAHGGLENYCRYKYIPNDLEPNSVSKTLEFSYDDWCIAQVAKALGKQKIYNQYIERAQYYKNLFDSTDTFMKGRNSSGFFRKNFRPTSLEDFIEGNSWHYSFFVPQDVNTLINLMGGDSAFVAKLDELFNPQEVSKPTEEALDVTGLIGNYAHGNEPSHHCAYLYAYAGKQWKTAEKVSQICSQLYGIGRDGLCGNEDCGQMSAWYALSAMGFYEVTPGSGVYVLGSPQFERISIKNVDGSDFNIIADALSEANIYIGSATWNGKPYGKSYITHDMITSGGTLVLNMQPTPHDDFGDQEDCRPHSLISENVTTPDKMFSDIPFTPYVDVDERFFAGYIKVTPSSIVNSDVYYTTDGSDPTISGKKSKGSIIINKDTELRMVSRKSRNGKYSDETSCSFYSGRILSAKIDFPATDERYSANGAATLTDGLHGGDNFTGGGWLGWNGGDIEISVELPMPKKISYIAVDFLSYLGAWITLPKYYTVEFETQSETVGPYKVNIPDKCIVSSESFVCGMNCNVFSKKFKVTIPKTTIPSWHNLHDKPGWVFIDEILVR